MLPRRIIARGINVVAKSRTQLKNSVRRFTTSADAGTPSRGVKIALGVAGALTVAGAVVYSRGSSVHAAENNGIDKQREFFNRFASITSAKGERMMTPDDFLRAITASEPEEARQRGSLDEAKFRILFGIADVDNTGLISFNEYLHFEDIINKPDAEYVLAFKIFDRDGNGFISKDDFKQVASTSFLTESKIPFDFNCELVRLYFGKGNNELSYSQFTQLLKDLQQERVKQEFRFYDTDESGYVSADKFAHILSGVKLRRIPQYIKDNLVSVANLNKGTKQEGKVSYAQFVACNDMLLHVPSYGRVLRAACQKNKTTAVGKDDFLREAQRSTSIEITRLEVDIIWELFDTDKDGKLSLLDFNKVTAPSRPAHLPAKVPVANKTLSQTALESIENFMLGAVAGGIGAFAVYPIDLVKTRMQNQRAVDPAKRMYKTSWDCFTKVVKNEGFTGLYKGLGPQIVGVAPEKAIKLTVNDLLRGLFADKSKGDIYFPLEVLAGAGAGMSQVLFTNPLEIVKIRLQVQGEGAVRGAKGVGAVTIIRELGFAGLYKGAGACLLRDIPFSAIYFPTYAKMKELLKDENGKLTATDLLLAGAVAGIPAASLVTPADVIKTRLQVKARAGEQTYSGIRDCFWKVLTAEGPKAFFKGCVARVFRSSPQFGVTLLSYELLQQFFAPHVTPRPPTNAPISEQDYANIAGTVIKVEEMEKKFGHLTIPVEQPKEKEGEEEDAKK